MTLSLMAGEPKMYCEGPECEFETNCIPYGFLIALIFAAVPLVLLYIALRNYASVVKIAHDATATVFDKDARYWRISGTCYAVKNWIVSSTYDAVKNSLSDDDAPPRARLTPLISQEVEDQLLSGSVDVLSRFGFGLVMI